MVAQLDASHSSIRPDFPITLTQLYIDGEWRNSNTGKTFNVADTLKHLTMKLGGKSANIIFADADLDAAAETAQ
ncbi:aldehyde dehydrogenase family protein [Fischerella sp. PCC 9605]|uniref:aldehyde dehydrogenase family protein n=1 Tax=Fischerella sp. PCC 9605 TaxID=1173024 RepID=UPI00047A18C3|nr:aldehyde dehydrogenase family protein [Fischerella sp. PCC 9605]